MVISTKNRMKGTIQCTPASFLCRFVQIQYRMAIKMKNFNYEQAMNELEKIIAQLESGSLSLEKSMQLFEQANKLALQCKTYLDTAEQKIVHLMQDGTEADGLE